MYKFIIAIACVLCVSSAVFGQTRFNNHNPHLQQQHLDFNDVLIQQKRVEFDAEYFLGLDGYFTLVDELEFAKAQRLTQERLKKTEEEKQQDRAVINGLIEQNKKVQELNQKLLEQNQKIIDILLKGGITVKPDPVTPLPTPIEPIPEPVPEPAPTPIQPVEPELVEPEPVTPSEPDSTKASQLDNSVFALFTKSRGGCVNCHGNETQEGGLQLVGEESGKKWLLNASLADRVIIYDRVANIDLKKRGLKTMPVGGPLFTTEEVNTVRLWMNERAQQEKKR